MNKQGKTTLSLKMDVYSFGILLFELAHYQRVFKIDRIRDEDDEVLAVNKIHRAIQR